MGTRVQSLLNTALNETSGERIKIIKFHMPKQTLDYIPYLFMSCQYEAFREGKEPAGHILSRIPIAPFIKFLEDLRDKYVILDPQNRDPIVSPIGYELVIAREESKTLCVMLKNSTYKPIGYISLNKHGGFSENDIEIMMKLSKELGSLLEFWDDTDCKAVKKFSFTPK
jgi:hypothetical protein